MVSIKDKMTLIELIKFAQDRIVYIRQSGYLTLNIRSTCDGLYLVECLTDVTAELKETKNETPRS